MTIINVANMRNNILLRKLLIVDWFKFYFIIFYKFGIFLFGRNNYQLIAGTIYLMVLPLIINCLTLYAYLLKFLVDTFYFILFCILGFMFCTIRYLDTDDKIASIYEEVKKFSKFKKCFLLIVTVAYIYFTIIIFKKFFIQPTE